ncbi:MAG: hypothetical protein GYB20_09495 [Oceanospirillales bacterium]|nr:hypothetical protein [Oceanospirillales bacterium]MBR9887910.1 hypothetical protein [Oceanospirillales bacterium]
MEQLLLTIITSALVATIAGAAINAWLESRKEKLFARFDALSAAITLEGYASACADAATDHFMARDSGGHAGGYIRSLPEFPEIEVAAGFIKSKKAKVADRLMFFPQEVRQADQVAHFLWDATADMDIVHEAAVEQVIYIGLKAIDLASDLRKAFSLPKRELVFGKYDIRETLSKHLKKTENA